ncbi:transposon protein, putative, CACTA, En/Spm sub-class [Cucumis melo var. makuwa]|uniref:Transposon protein, putative, CACTA, En/Spm sub-class n=1 Tax=Cucumis melo var. makuwa TaxID=1194695 RepID=A0A5A7SPV4_CUCMM|nr:transposon protein, putative, CACTA, En/Spm sub-class [Cucumis melo var. makuwa]TYK16856.1 transposon protein, putative, CACTA, En/Spm sub-class [Cucumis melo var. makuwa]
MKRLRELQLNSCGIFQSFRGPKQPGYDINVYLEPLIDDLKLMWEEVVQCFDAHRKEFFTFVKGYKACPICGEETSSIRLPHGKKNAYMGHRKYLPSHHPYRRQKKAFDEMNIRPELAPVSDGSRAYTPTACYTLSREEKVSICRTLSDLKVPEGLIAEADICEEAVEFCSEFLSGLDPIGLDEHNRSFPNWIRDEVMREIQEGQVVSTTIRWIAHNPHPLVMIYEGDKVNGICYNTKPRDDTRTIQNSRIMFVASTMHVASAKDKNPIIA